MVFNKNIIVIGGNAAGPSAAAKAKRISPQSNVMLFEAGDYISTGTCELPYVLSGDIEDYKNIIFFNADSFFEKKGVKVYVRHKVKQIDRKAKKIIVNNMADNNSVEFFYDKLILSTGSIPKAFPKLSSNLNNVFHLKTVNDYLNISNYISTNSVKNILIVGAGYIGLESAEAFKKLGMNVTLIEKKFLPLPDSDLEIQNLVLDNLVKNGVEFIGRSCDVKFIINDKRVEKYKLAGRIIETDLILLSTGFEPNISLAIGAKLQIGSLCGIMVDNKLITSDPNIFAAGDCVEIKNFITKRNDYIPLATFAHEHGHVAGANSAGGNEFVNPVIKNIAVKIFDNTLVRVGITESEAGEHNITFRSVSAVVPNLVKVMPESIKVFGKIIYEKASKRILGASFFGGDEVIGYGDLISGFILNNISADKLSEINYNYTPPKSPFINLLSVLGRKIREDRV